MLVEEIPKKSNTNSSLVYFSSSINLTARPNPRLNNDVNHETNPNTKKAKINYNLNDLMNKQIQVSDNQKNSGPLKSSQQLTLERLVTKRILDLSKEGGNQNFELPKNFEYNGVHVNSKNANKARQGNTPSTKKILSARRNLNLYFEEERNLVSVNSILRLNYQYLDQLDSYNNSGKEAKLFRPRIKLCCICSDISNYARCSNCGLFYCSIKCNRIHQEMRCN